VGLLQAVLKRAEAGAEDQDPALISKEVQGTKEALRGDNLTKLQPMPNFS